MYPVNNISGIKEQESRLEGSHAIILLFVKPSDDNADSIIKNSTICTIAQSNIALFIWLDIRNTFTKNTRMHSKLAELTTLLGITAISAL